MISDEATAETYSRVGRSLPLTLPEHLGKVPCAMRRRRGKGAILDAYFSVARAGLRRGHEDNGESPSVSRKGLPERMHQGRYWVCKESVHEESHGIGPV